MVAIVWTLKKKASRNDPGRAFSMASPRATYASAKSALAARYDATMTVIAQSHEARSMR